MIKILKAKLLIKNHKKKFPLKGDDLVKLGFDKTR